MNPTEFLSVAATAVAAYACLLPMSVPAQDPTPPAAGHSQDPPQDPVAKAALGRLDASRLPAAATAAHSLRVEGKYTVTFGNATEPVAQGPFTEIYRGADLARQTTSMGEMGTMEKGVFHGKAWEVDPSMGAKVHGGRHADAVRRYFALLSGRALTPLYKGFAGKGEAKVGDATCSVLELTPTEGPADLAYLDGEGRLVRFDIALPVPESAEAGFGLDDVMRAEVALGDWRTESGVAYPHRRAMRMGPATVTLVATKVQVGIELADSAFAPPAAVDKATPLDATAAFDKDGKPLYQIVERPAQPVVSIRVKCKPGEISATLGMLLPEIMGHIMASGGKMAGPPFSRYHAWSDAEIDLEAGIPVVGKIEEKGRIKNSELPGGKVVTCWHIGPYEKLTGAHEGLRAHLQAEKLKARGGVWEVYWTDPGMVQDQSKWRTQLFAPIE
ncbi:MAG: GyrI-like domain-containing protein [Planctomycetota bacterium]